MSNLTHVVRRNAVLEDPAKVARYQEAHSHYRNLAAGRPEGSSSLPEARELIEDAALTYAETGLGLTDPESFLEALRKQEIAGEVHRMTIRQEAARRVAARAQSDPWPPDELAALLDEADEDPEYRIAGLLPTGAHAVLAAAYKAGKSTMVGNLIRCLVDGAPFLGRYAVNRPAERVLLIDFELDKRTLKRWLRDQVITCTHRVDVLSLRGQASSFNILDPATRKQWARRLEGADVVILDCLRPAMDALGLDEHREAGKFLVAFDELLADIGAEEAVIVHHMGHDGERSRGDSRIQDYPDVTFKILREEKDDPASARYFSAYGRDVDVPEQQLGFDPETRHLSINGGSRRSGALDGRIDAVLEFLQNSSAPVSKTGLRAALKGDQKLTAKAIDEAVQRGILRAEPRQGKGGGYWYSPATPKPVQPV